MKIFIFILEELIMLIFCVREALLREKTLNKSLVRKKLVYKWESFLLWELMLLKQDVNVYFAYEKNKNIVENQAVVKN